MSDISAIASEMRHSVMNTFYTLTPGDRTKYGGVIWRGDFAVAIFKITPSLVKDEWEASTGVCEVVGTTGVFGDYHKLDLLGFAEVTHSSIRSNAWFEFAAKRAIDEAKKLEEIEDESSK